MMLSAVDDGGMIENIDSNGKPGKKTKSIDGSQEIKIADSIIDLEAGDCDENVKRSECYLHRCVIADINYDGDDDDTDLMKLPLKHKAG